MPDCCFDSVKLFLLPVTQGCFSHVSVSFWNLGHPEAEQPVCPHRNGIAFLGSNTLISAYLPWFALYLTDKTEDLMLRWWPGGPDVRTAAIWAGWPRTWSLEAPPANPYLVTPSPHLRKSGSKVGDVDVGVGACFCQLVSVFTTDGGWWRGSIVLSCLPWREISFASKRAILPEEIASVSEERSRRHCYSLHSILWPASNFNSVKGPKVTCCFQSALRATAKEQV